MARTNDYFPVCKPHRASLSRLGSSIANVRYNSYRNISSGFISRKDVRSIIMERDSNRCTVCGSSKKLEIDHIVSVYYAFVNKISIYELNSESNLQVLCKSCNSSKSPNK